MPRITRNIIIDHPAKFKRQVLQWANVNFDTVCYLDNNHYKGYLHHSFEILIAVGARNCLQLKSGKAFDAVKDFYENEKDWLFGFFGYDLKNEIENLSSENHDGTEFPDLFIFQPEFVIEIYEKHAVVHSFEISPFPSAVLTELQETGLPQTFEPSIRLNARIPKNDYLKTIGKIHNHIQRGNIYEMNLCQEFFAEDVKMDPFNTFLKLNELSKAPFSCYLKFDCKYLLSASPERFLKKQGNRLISMPIKGTARRGKNEGEDKVILQNFFRDRKERSENVMIVDLVRHDLSKSCVPGSVKVEELFGIKTFPQVHQMVSTITGTLRSDIHFIDAIRNAFPMGSMTGAPKVRAMELIEQYEQSRRGLYSGAVGYITPDGNFDFNVVIRSLIYNSINHYLSFHVGSAIVFDSISEKEYQECLLKAQALMAVLTVSASHVSPAWNKAPP